MQISIKCIVWYLIGKIIEYNILLSPLILSLDWFNSRIMIFKKWFLWVCIREDVVCTWMQVFLEVTGIKSPGAVTCCWELIDSGAGTGSFLKLWAIPTARPPLQPWGLVPEDLKPIRYLQLSFTVQILSRSMSSHKNWNIFVTWYKCIKNNLVCFNIYSEQCCDLRNVRVIHPNVWVGGVFFSSSSLPLPNPLIQKSETFVCEMHSLAEHNL